MQIISNLGASLSFICLLIALYGSFAAVFGGLKKKPLWVESSRRAVLTAFALLSLSTLSLVFLLVSGDFQVAYVYSVTSSSMPLYLKITALWGAQAGSLLFWAWMLAGFSAAACRRYRKEHADFLPWIIAVFLVTLEFFLFLVIFVDNPFVRYWQTSTGEAKALFQPKGAFPLIPEDGSGLNPLLRHLGMVLHPPMQYLGYVAFIIPYAFAIASLITGSRNDRWLRLSRRWTLAAWLFLSLGLVLGSRWA